MAGPNRGRTASPLRVEGNAFDAGGGEGRTRRAPREPLDSLCAWRYHPQPVRPAA